MPLEQVAVDWTACRARGVCSELLPERIALDEWGYPLLDPAPVPGDLAAYARQAVSDCPTRALRLQAVAPRRPVAAARGASARPALPPQPHSERTT